MNSSSMHQDGAIDAQVKVVNTLGRNVSVSNFVQNDTYAKWSNYDDICPSDFFMGFAVFQGHFAPDNISVANNPLRLAPPMITTCGGISGGFVGVRFLPNGSRAFASLDPNQPNHFFWNVSAVIHATTVFCVGSPGNCSWYRPGLIGYWDWSIPNRGNYGPTSPSFMRFSLGEYTLVGWDDWNQYIYTTFIVEPQENSFATDLGASCVVPVPVGSTLDPYFHNSTFAGDKVTLTNGTEKFYSYFSCPRPVLRGFNDTSGTPNVYAMALAAVTNSTFIAAENGSQFVLLHSSLSGCCDQDAGHYVQLYFFHYGGRGSLDICLDNQTLIPFYVRSPDAGIIVTFHAAASPGAAWGFGNPTIQVMSSCQQLIGNFQTGVVANYGGEG